MTGRAIFITHRTVPGARCRVQAVWQRHLQPTIDANPGHLSYHYCFDVADSDVIRVFQLYIDPTPPPTSFRAPRTLPTSAR